MKVENQSAAQDKLKGESGSPVASDQTTVPGFALDGKIKTDGPDDAPIGWSRWIENGQWYKAPTVDREHFGSHDYGKGGFGECKCGCHMSGYSSCGPVDPFGACPLNPRKVPSLEPASPIAEGGSESPQIPKFERDQTSSVYENTTECVRLLEAAGMGKAGYGNCLVDMVKEIIAYMEAVEDRLTASTPDAPERNTGLGQILRWDDSFPKEDGWYWVEMPNHDRVKDEALIGIAVRHVELAANQRRYVYAGTLGWRAEGDPVLQGWRWAGPLGEPVEAPSDPRGVSSNAPSVSSPKSSCVAASAGQEEGEWSVRDDGSQGHAIVDRRQGAIALGLRYEIALQITAAYNASLREKEGEVRSLRTDREAWRLVAKGKEGAYVAMEKQVCALSTAIDEIRDINPFNGGYVRIGEICDKARLAAEPEPSEQKATQAPQMALKALRELRSAISDFQGHGMPGFTDRAQAYLVLQQADKCLSSHAPTQKEQEQ